MVQFFFQFSFIRQKNEVRRSDLVRIETRNDYMVPMRDDYHGSNNQYLHDVDEQETTTEGIHDDYLAHDTESVDRLALDGETREPINSSTINSYNY